MRLSALTSLPFAALLSSCYYLQGTSIPIKTIEYKKEIVTTTAKTKKDRDLFVLLPGIGDRAGVFDKFGIVEKIHNENKNANVVAVEAHFKYYQTRTIIDRLRVDIIQPAIAQGYRDIYLVGTSLGGFGSLLYLKLYPNEISKIFIFAPYLGDPQDYNYLLNNQAPPIAPRDVNLWPWLTQLPESTRAKIYLGFGEKDKFSTPNTLLAKYLKQNQVVTNQGKHNWTTWAELWGEMMEKTPSS
jgi:pimeloyl-ACP methyl ester carboxylesterase